MIHWNGFSSVCTFMCHSLVSWRDSLCSSIRHLPGVCSNVDLMINIMCESFVTLSAFYWLLASVCSHMGVIATNMWEGFATCDALLWSLSRVIPLSIDILTICHTPIYFSVKNAIIGKSSHMETWSYRPHEDAY